MKGHVKLELRNANGETKVVNQDNLITNYVGMHRNYIGTICNLKTPIEKTADQTLRVTYTLTDVNT